MWFSPCPVIRRATPRFDPVLEDLSFFTVLAALQLLSDESTMNFAKLSSLQTDATFRMPAFKSLDELAGLRPESQHFHFAKVGQECESGLHESQALFGIIWHGRGA